jgi:hypothetical protein
MYFLSLVGWLGAWCIDCLDKYYQEAVISGKNCNDLRKSNPDSDPLVLKKSYRKWSRYSTGNWSNPLNTTQLAAK